MGRVVCWAMRCLIGFFGITRSLPHTAASIRAAFDEPLRRAGFEVRRVGHFNMPSRIDNPRSGEAGITPDQSESALLDLDLCWHEAQDDAAIELEWTVGRAFPDAFGDDYRSLRNLCHQLRSLERLWSMIELLGPTDDDLVLLLRPDLFYVDALDPAFLKPLRQRRADLIVPGWQDWGGLNDRFAFCTPPAARLVATRNRLFIDGCAALGGMHSESFLRFVAERGGLRVATTSMRALRIRAGGGIAPNDAAMLQEETAAAA